MDSSTVGVFKRKPPVQSGRRLLVLTVPITSYICIEPPINNTRNPRPLPDGRIRCSEVRRYQGLGGGGDSQRTAITAMGTHEHQANRRRSRLVTGQGDGTAVEKI